MQTPIMRADDEERNRVYELSSEQKKAFTVMALIQVAMTVITYILFALQAVTGIKYGVGCIPTVIIFMVIYLNFLKLAGYVADCGISVGWIKAMRILSPIAYLIAFVLCVITLVG